MAGNKRPGGPIKYPWWLQSSSASSSRLDPTGASAVPISRRSKLRLSAVSPPPPKEGKPIKAVEAVDEASKPHALAEEFDRAMEAAKEASIATKAEEDANRKPILISDWEVEQEDDRAEEEEEEEEDGDYWTNEDEETPLEEGPEVIVILSDDEA